LRAKLARLVGHPIKTSTKFGAIPSSFLNSIKIQESLAALS